MRIRLKGPRGGNADYWKKVAEELANQVEELRSLCTQALGALEQAVGLAASDKRHVGPLLRRFERRAGLNLGNEAKRENAEIRATLARALGRKYLEAGSAPHAVARRVKAHLERHGITAGTSIATLSRQLKGVLDPVRRSQRAKSRRGARH